MTYSIPNHLRGSVWTGLSHYGVIDKGDAEVNGQDLAAIAEYWWETLQHANPTGWQDCISLSEAGELLAILTEVAEYAIDNNYADAADEESFPADVKFANQAEEIIAWFTDVALTSALR